MEQIFSQRCLDSSIGKAAGPTAGNEMDGVEGSTRVPALPCFVINLDTQVTRWQAVQMQFAQVGITPIRFPAVLGAELPDDVVARLYSQELNRQQYHKPLVAGEIGCYASHLSVWEHIVREGLPMAVVFEDDIAVGQELPRVLEAVASLPSGWDMIKLVGRGSERPLWTCPLDDATALITYRRLPSLTGAYVVSCEGAAKLLRGRKPFGRPIDVDLRYWWECELRVLGLHPYPVQLAETSRSSTITGRYTRSRLRGERLRKLWLQARYSLLNALHRQRQWLPGMPHAS